MLEDFKKIFLMYLFMWKGVHTLSYRTNWCVIKLGRDEVIMVLHMREGFSARSAQRWIQGGAKIGQWGTL